MSKFIVAVAPGVVLAGAAIATPKGGGGRGGGGHIGGGGHFGGVATRLGQDQRRDEMKRKPQTAHLLKAARKPV